MMNARVVSISAVTVLLVSALAPAADESTGASDGWWDIGETLAMNTGERSIAEREREATATGAPAKAPPIPFHSIEGYGGGAITPMAYLINRGPEGTVAGLPSVSFTFCKLGSKDLQVVGITQTFFRRFELGYAFNRMGLGSLPDDIKKRLGGVDINRDEVYLHHFNIRALLLEENSFDLPLPAVTAGVHFKYNDTIKKIDRRLGGALKGIGLDKSNGVDYTLTATKMFPKLAVGRPIILTGGLRLSNAAQIGYLGFGNQCAATFEGSVAYLPFDQLVLVYEFRHKENPYDKIDKIIGDEDNWHAITGSWVVNEHMTITAGWHFAGNIANSHADGGWAIQVKWEF